MQWRDHLSTNFAFPPGYSKSSCPVTSEQRAGRAAIGTQLAIPILINLLHEVCRPDLTRDAQVPTVTALSRESRAIPSKLSLSAPSTLTPLCSRLYSLPCNVLRNIFCRNSVLSVSSVDECILDF